jgi:hypothetical protein
LVPFLIVCFFVAYLDRVNVRCAALTMNRDLGLSASAFRFGAGRSTNLPFSNRASRRYRRPSGRLKIVPLGLSAAISRWIVAFE